MSEELQKNYLDEIVLPKKIVREIEEVAKEKKLTKEQVKKLEEEVKKEYLRSRFEPGEAIGIIAAQSISEPATQMTMRTYHFAGSAGIKVTYGLPRLIEIFDAKKNPETPMMTIYLKKEFNNKDDAKKVAEKILEKKVVKLMKRASINLSEGLIEIEPVDLRKIDSIANAIKENFKDLKVQVKRDTIVIKPKKEIEVRELQRMREKILNTKVSGIEGISNVVVRREGDDWIINTIGSNLEEVLKIKEVDSTRTITNDIYETARVLGIEAARNLIINEAQKTLEEQGLNVDIRHLMLVGDIMTRSGTIKPIGRYGVAGAKSSILARAAFEETIKHLVKASVRNEVDSFQGIFENVMIGQVVPAGTGMFELVARFEEEEQ
ncbi:MAG: DNA-directed RNA polymerase subunit A'' [Candidatus Aenigmatarchaeota archaeon]